MLSASIAVAVALALSPSAAPANTGTSPAAELDEVVGATQRAAPLPGSVGVALPRAVGLPQIDTGSIVHAVGVNDPLVSGEVRETSIVVRSARVLGVGETSVTIEASESDALALVEAMTTGSVVLVAVGGR